jgi:hypothetical protein
MIEVDSDGVAGARTAVLERMPAFACAQFRDNFPATDPYFIETYVDGLR